MPPNSINPSTSLPLPINSFLLPPLLLLSKEPLWQAGGRAVGCRVAGFKRLPDGSVGQAELMGSTRPGDVLAEVDGVAVNDMSFDKVRGFLL